MIKPIRILLLAASLVFLLTGCAEEILLTTMSGKEYEVTGAQLVDEYANRIPESGWSFLLVSIRGQESDLDNIQATFYGPESRAAVTDGATTAECQLIVYAPAKSGELDAILLFEVPETFSEDFQLYGPAFQSVDLNVEKNRRR